MILIFTCFLAQAILWKWFSVSSTQNLWPPFFCPSHRVSNYPIFRVLSMQWYKVLLSDFGNACICPFFFIILYYRLVCSEIHDTKAKIFTVQRFYSKGGSLYSTLGRCLVILSMCFFIVSILSPQEYAILLRLKTLPIGSLSNSRVTT